MALAIYGIKHATDKKINKFNTTTKEPNQTNKQR
jgi:hypothetical protein